MAENRVTENEMVENTVVKNKTAGNTVAKSKATDNKITGNAVAKRKKGRYLYMDILNIMACFCVVFIHHSNTLVRGIWILRF